MATYRTFEAPKGYTRIYSARRYNDAEKLADELKVQGRSVALVYAHNCRFAVYAKV